MGYNNKKIFPPQSLAGSALDTARRLIADLVNEKDQVEGMGAFRLMPAMLPETMKFERDVLGLCYQLSKLGIAPTRETITSRLALTTPDAEVKMNELLAYQSPERPEVPMLAFAISDWIQRQALEITLRDILAQVENASYEITLVLYQMAIERLTEAAPNLNKVKSISQVKALDEFIARQNERYEMYRSGIPLGPDTPWAKLNSHIGGYHRPGDLWHWTAKTKHGKSVIAQILGEHAAYTVGGIYVDFFHLETTVDDFAYRRMCRELKIPSNQLYKTNLNDPKIREYIQQYREWTTKREERGRFNYKFCPNISIEELLADMVRGSMEAANLGMKYMVIVDYYQEISSDKHSGNEAAKLNDIATRLKNQVQSLGAFGHAFSQYDPDADYGMKSTSWGAKKMSMRAQVNIRLQRPDKLTDTDMPLWDGVNTPKLNFFGDQVYSHRAGQLDSAAVLEVLSANHGYKGKVRVQFLNEYYDLPATDESEANLPDFKDVIFPEDEGDGI